MFEEVSDFENEITWDKLGGIIKSEISYTCHLITPISLKELFSKIPFDKTRYLLNFTDPDECFLVDLQTFNRLQITIEQTKYMIIYPCHNCQPKTVQDLYELIQSYISKIVKNIYRNEDGKREREANVSGSPSKTP